MADAAPQRLRPSVDGKFFRLGEKKFYVKGVSYGPFAPDPRWECYAPLEQTAEDFACIQQLGANVVRVYTVPPKWLLDLATRWQLLVLIEIPWNKHVCFLDSPKEQEHVRDAVRRAVGATVGHPAIFGFNVANEIPADVVRWSGAAAVADFIDELILVAKKTDPECLCTFSNFPPTEFVRPQRVDFISFNVYLHQEAAFKNYLARLQLLADSKPLLLSEFGIDSLREGEARKCELLTWQIETVFRGGLAGGVVFSYTDDWWHGHQRVENWAMGLTARDRRPRDSFQAVKGAFHAAPYFPLWGYPRVSVVVASYNGERTLKACLESLQNLNYPDYEVILVDDGSTDGTPQIARSLPSIRCLRHARNLGLSAARNTGIAAATGAIVAFTDADCRADPDWLYYLVGGLSSGEFAGVGGPNLLPPDDSAVAAAVMASPGGPTQVMLTNRQAEHIPGCNMAFFKWSLAEVAGFDPQFRSAGDDVDLCWRLQQAGYRIGFSPGAFVWHYRRSTPGEYLKQQHGYGEAEALLVRKHPEHFNSLGGSIWRGRIYSSSPLGLFLRPAMIYRGLFGSGGFQSVYAREPALTLMVCTSLEYHVLVTLPLWIFSVIWPVLLSLAVTSLLVSVAVCVAAGAQASLPRQKQRSWSKPLVSLLFFLQPIVRGWARYQGRLFLRPASLAAHQTLDSIALRESKQPLKELDYWGTEPVNRLAFVGDLLRRLDHEGWPNKSDIGWCDYDIEVYGSRWSTVQITTVAEEHPQSRFLIRCRLTTRWSLAAKVAFGLLTCINLLVLGFGLHRTSWVALVLVSLPVFTWWRYRQQRTLQSLLVVFLDEFAAGLQLSRAVPKPEPRANNPRPATRAFPSPFDGQSPRSKPEDKSQ